MKNKQTKVLTEGARKTHIAEVWKKGDIFYTHTHTKRLQRNK